MKKQFYLKVFLLVIGFTIVLAVSQAEDNFGKAEAELKAAIALKNSDVTPIQKAAQQIARFNNDKAVRLLVDEAGKMANDARIKEYWAIITVLPLLGNDNVLDTLSDFIIKNKSKPLGMDALGVLKANTSPVMVKLLTRVMENGSPLQQLQALDHLKIIKSKSTVSALIEFLKRTKDKDLIRQTIKTLQALLGKGIGQTYETITQWWTQHQNDEEKTLFTEPGEAGKEKTDTVIDYIDISINPNPDKIVVVSSDCKGCEGIGKMPPVWDHNYDHIENILQKMKIPHKVIKKSEFDKDDFKLNDRLVVLFNCNNIVEHCINPEHHRNPAPIGRQATCSELINHKLYTNILSAKGVAKIKDFVANGGYFFSEDWIIKEVLDRAFKEVISHNKDSAGQNVSVLPAPGSLIHPYLKGVFEKPVTKIIQASPEETISVKTRELKIGEGKWKIDKLSPDIIIEKPQGVTILMVSPELKAIPKDSGALAITFAYGPQGLIQPTNDESEGYYSPMNKKGGQVLHVVSHFGNQAQPTDEFILQNLLLNFIVEAIERDQTK